MTEKIAERLVYRKPNQLKGKENLKDRSKKIQDDKKKEQNKKVDDNKKDFTRIIVIQNDEYRYLRTVYVHVRMWVLIGNEEFASLYWYRIVSIHAIPWLRPPYGVQLSQDDKANAVQVTLPLSNIVPGTGPWRQTAGQATSSYLCRGWASISSHRTRRHGHALYSRLWIPSETINPYRFFSYSNASVSQRRH